MTHWSKIGSLSALFGLLTLTATAPAESLGLVDGKTYDYIVVGGGLSGLVVANRLTEDQNSALQFVAHKATPKLTHSSFCTSN
jgi:hypothetical protein